jgi:hypothetical protein
MKTADLIALLAADTGPIDSQSPTRRTALATLAGVLLSCAALVFWLGLRPLGEAAHERSFWMKAGYAAALALAGWLMVGRLARPGGRLGAGPVLALLAIAAIGGLAAAEMWRAPPGTGHALMLGQTWRLCSWRIVALAVPIYLALVWVLRRMAPTRLALTGAGAGLLSGAAGAAVYGLYCQESAAMFVAVWYTLGVAASAALGAAVGARLLRW